MKCVRSNRAWSAGLLVGALLLGTTSPARAAVVLFDLENQSVSAATSQTTLSLAGTGEILTVSRQGGGNFGVADLSPYSGTTPFGARSLAPDTSTTTPILVNFSVPVASFSLSLGHFGADDANLSLTAFSGANGTGSVVGTSTDTLLGIDANTFTFRNLEVDAANIGSVVAKGGVAGDNSVYYDNFAADTTPVPEPALLGMFTVAALFGIRRNPRCS